MLNSKLREICQLLISKLKFWLFLLFLTHTPHYLCKQQGIWGTEACKEKLVDFDALDEVPCPPQMKRETFLSQIDLEAPFQADLELEADEFESNNNVQNEPNFT